MNFWPDDVIERRGPFIIFKEVTAPGSWMLVALPASLQPHPILFVLAVGRWIRCIQCMKFIRCEYQ